MTRKIPVMVAMIFMTLLGCYRPAATTSNDAGISSSSADPYTLAIIRRAMENGERVSGGVDRVDDPGEEEVLKLFGEIDWTDSRQTPTFSLSRSNNENLSIRRPDGNIESNDLAAEWRMLDGERFTVLIAEPLQSSEEASRLLAAFYRGQELHSLADWKPKSD